MISVENIRYYANWWVANQKLEFLCQTDNEQGRLSEHLENTLHYCQCCYLINYSQKSSIVWGVEIEYNWKRLMANEMARVVGMWPMRRCSCGPITGWIWLRYSQLIFSTKSQLQAAALCGTSIFSSPDATIRVDRLLKYQPIRSPWPVSRPKVTNEKSVGVCIKGTLKQLSYDVIDSCLKLVSGSLQWGVPLVISGLVQRRQIDGINNEK